MDRSNLNALDLFAKLSTIAAALVTALMLSSAPARANVVKTSCGWECDEYWPNTSWPGAVHAYVGVGNDGFTWLVYENAAPPYNCERAQIGDSWGLYAAVETNIHGTSGSDEFYTPQAWPVNPCGLYPLSDPGVMGGFSIVYSMGAGSDTGWFHENPNQKIDLGSGTTQGNSVYVVRAKKIVGSNGPDTVIGWYAEELSAYGNAGDDKFCALNHRWTWLDGGGGGMDTDKTYYYGNNTNWFTDIESHQSLTLQWCNDQATAILNAMLD
jgi:hypothetical protein